jgi:hypothetical protein
MTPGDTVRIDFPSHAAHGKSARVVSFDPAFNLAPDDAEPLLSPVVFVRWDGQREPIGLGLSHIGGTAENKKWREEEHDDEGRQGDLGL